MPCTIFDTPVGRLGIQSGMDDVITRISWMDSAAADMADDNALLAEARSQFIAYFDGRLTAFDLPLEEAASPRGESLRSAIAAIPYGETASYGEVARRADSGPRAIGQACARNPFPIVIPCHRVIGAKGTPGHYSAGRGLETKMLLIRHELKNANQPSR